MRPLLVESRLYGEERGCCHSTKMAAAIPPGCVSDVGRFVNGARETLHFSSRAKPVFVREKLHAYTPVLFCRKLDICLCLLIEEYFASSSKHVIKKTSSMSPAVSSKGRQEFISAQHQQAFSPPSRLKIQIHVKLRAF